MKERTFNISTMGGIHDTADIVVAREIFSNNIHLSDFGEGVKRIMLYALTFHEDDQLFAPFWSYNSKKKKLKVVFL